MCCRNDYRLSIYFLSACTQLRFVQLFNKALLLLLLLLLLYSIYFTSKQYCATMIVLQITFTPPRSPRTHRKSGLSSSYNWSSVVSTQPANSKASSGFSPCIDVVIPFADDSATGKTNCLL